MIIAKIELMCGDCLELMNNIQSDSAHLILSDIPYGINFDSWDIIHNNTNSALLGSSPAQKKCGSIFKKRGKPLNGWSQSDKNIPKEYYEWCSEWSHEWYRVLKPCASVFIFAGRRFAHRCICAMEDAGFIYKDMICWEKNIAPHRAQRVSLIYDKRGDTYNANKWSGWRLGNLRPLFEPILWFIKPYKIGGTIADNIIENGVGAYNCIEWNKYNELTANMIKIDNNKQDHGKHPTQKPLELMEALIKLTTKDNQVVLDPFMGSGTTGVACKNLNRDFIGIELNEEYFEIARERIESA